MTQTLQISFVLSKSLNLYTMTQIPQLYFCATKKTSTYTCVTYIPSISIPSRVYLSHQYDFKDFMTKKEVWCICVTMREFTAFGDKKKFMIFVSQQAQFGVYSGINPLYFLQIGQTISLSVLDIPQTLYVTIKI